MKLRQPRICQQFSAKWVAIKKPATMPAFLKMFNYEKQLVFVIEQVKNTYLETTIFMIV